MTPAPRAALAVGLISTDALFYLSALLRASHRTTGNAWACAAVVTPRL